jgi:hypothetical protein
MTIEHIELARMLISRYPELLDDDGVAFRTLRRKMGEPQLPRGTSHRVLELEDNATGGVLLGMLKESGQLESVWWDDFRNLWEVHLVGKEDGDHHTGSALAEACAKALLAHAEAMEALLSKEPYVPTQRDLDWAASVLDEEEK